MMTKYNLSIGVIFILLLCWLSNQANKFASFSTGVTMSPGFMPKLTIRVMMILTIIFILQSIYHAIKRLNQGKKAASISVNEIAVLLIVILFGIILNIFGYWLSGLAFLITLAVLLEKNSAAHWRVNIFIMVVAIVVVYAFFEFILNAPLPMGELFM